MYDDEARDPINYSGELPRRASQESFDNPFLPREASATASAKLHITETFLRIACSNIVKFRVEPRQTDILAGHPNSVDIELANNRMHWGR